jgi:hypothetical protein
MGAAKERSSAAAWVCNWETKKAILKGMKRVRRLELVRDDAKETGMAVVRESTRDAAKEQQRAPSTAHLKASKWAVE